MEYIYIAHTACRSDDTCTAGSTFDRSPFSFSSVRFVTKVSGIRRCYRIQPRRPHGLLSTLIIITRNMHHRKVWAAVQCDVLAVSYIQVHLAAVRFAGPPDRSSAVDASLKVWSTKIISLDIVVQPHISNCDIVVVEDAPRCSIRRSRGIHSNCKHNIKALWVGMLCRLPAPMRATHAPHILHDIHGWLAVVQ